MRYENININCFPLALYVIRREFKKNDYLETIILNNMLLKCVMRRDIY